MRRDLISELVVLSGQTLALLLQSLNVVLTSLELLLESSDLSHITSSSQLSRILATGPLVALVHLNLVFKTKDIEDHGVSAVQDEGEEKGEAAEVHVALRVKLAGLDFHTLSSNCMSMAWQTMQMSVTISCGVLDSYFYTQVARGGVTWTYPELAASKPVSSIWTR